MKDIYHIYKVCFSVQRIRCSIRRLGRLVKITVCCGEPPLGVTLSPAGNWQISVTQLLGGDRMEQKSLCNASCNNPSLSILSIPSIISILEYAECSFRFGSAWEGQTQKVNRTIRVLFLCFCNRTKCSLCKECFQKQKLSNGFSQNYRDPQIIVML